MVDLMTDFCSCSSRVAYCCEFAIMSGRNVPRLVVVLTCRKGYFGPFSYDKVVKRRKTSRQYRLAKEDK